jgi:hypothetical protein
MWGRQADRAHRATTVDQAPPCYPAALLALRLTAALLLPAGPAVATTVELGVTSTPQLRDGALSLDVRIQNSGDEPAVGLGVRLRAFGRAIEAPGRTRLEPNQTWSASFPLPAAALVGGRWVYVLDIEYAKRDSYPQHGIHADTLVVGSPPEPAVTVAALDAAPLGTAGVLRAQVRNGGARARPVQVAVYAPAGLEAPAPSWTIDVGAGESVWVEFPLVNRTEVPWSRQPVYVAVEYEEDGVRQSALARVAVEIVPSLFGLTRWRWQLWTVAGLATLAWLVAVGWRAATSRFRDRDVGRGPDLDPDLGLASSQRVAPRRRLLRIGTDVGAVILASGVVCSVFPWSRVLESTTPAGGDAASHYYAAVYMRDVLLPRGGVTGWCPGSFAGFPLFQFYFPLPFVLMALLSLAVPMSVAFKLVTTLGPVALPACAYASLRLLGTPFPGPALAALSTLCFLFLETNSMWGGNILSTVAGEFTYAIALDLGLLFIGGLARVMRANRGRVRAGVVLAGVGLSHGYVLLWVGFVSLLELLVSRERARRLLGLLAIHGQAVLLMAFWLVPLLWYAPWTTPYDPVSTFGSWQVAFPPVLQLAAGLAVAFGAVALSVERADLHPLGILWGGIAIALGMYTLAPALGVVDVRFLPFAQLGLCLAAAAALGIVLGRLPGAETWPIVGVLAVLPFAHAQVRIAPFQALYTYSGFEAKVGWPLYQRLSQHLRGDFRDPRVAYEHSVEHVTLGSERAFENLPLFSGRSTLDGLYMQSSATSPFVYYAQSEISLESTCPLPDWGCARPDLDRGLGHLEMLNVSHFIARSPEIRAAARRQPRLTTETEIDGYEVFRLQDNDGRYVVPLTVAPFLVRTAAWKEAAFRWFKHTVPAAPMPVFALPSSEGEEAGFAGIFDAVPADPPRVALPAPPVIEEELDIDRVRVSGCRPGHPLLVRISYHPRWRARTGERIWQAGPNLMLVFPRGQTIELEFASPLVVLLGRVATALGLLIVVVGIVAARARALAARATPDAMRRAIGLGATMVGRVERMTMPRAARWPLLVGGGALLAALLAMVLRVEPSQHRLYLRAQEHYKAGRLDEALPLFQRAQRGAPLSRFRSLGRYFEAMIHFQRERWEPARQGFASVLAEFPEAITAPAAAYHLGVCEARLGDFESARHSWDRTMREFPGTPWANLAAERRRELAAP